MTTQKTHRIRTQDCVNLYYTLTLIFSSCKLQKEQRASVDQSAVASGSQSEKQTHTHRDTLADVKNSKGETHPPEQNYNLLLRFCSMLAPLSICSEKKKKKLCIDHVGHLNKKKKRRRRMRRGV